MELVLAVVETNNTASGASASPCHTVGTASSYSSVVPCCSYAALHCLCLQEFRRLNSSLGAARDRAELLMSAGDSTPLLNIQVSGGAHHAAVLHEHGLRTTLYRQHCLSQHAARPSSPVVQGSCNCNLHCTCRMTCTGTGCSAQYTPSTRMLPA